MSKQIITFTGAKGSGKSTAMALYIPPSDYSKLCVVDSEDSWSDLIRNLSTLNIKPGAYLRAYERFQPSGDLLGLMAQNKLPWVSSQQKNSLLGLYDWFITTLDKTLTTGRFKYLILDSIEPLEAAMTAYVETNRSKAGWSGDRSFGRMETEGVRPLYEFILESVAQRGIETILLSSHLKQPWEGNRPITNKVEPGGRIKLLSRLSSMMFWLTQSNDNADGAPAAIVLKARLSNLQLIDGRWQVRRVLPARIPHFTWSDVEHYRQHPADLAHPQTGEALTQADQEMISEMLSDEQMRLMLLNAEIDAKEGPLVMTQPLPVAMEEMTFIPPPRKPNGNIPQP